MKILLAYWAAYFALHSALASLTVKSRVASLWPGFPYRIAYNCIAIVLLLPGAWLLWGRSWPALWTVWKPASLLLQFLAAAGFLLTLGYYDMKAFLGLKPEKSEAFTISPFHRYVRHPWYFFALVLIWSSDMNTGKFATDIMATLYLFLGSRHEESMLIAFHGEKYAEYRKRVPGLFPLPWKYLNESEAASLVKWRDAKSS